MLIREPSYSNNDRRFSSSKTQGSSIAPKRVISSSLPYSSLNARSSSEIGMCQRNETLSPSIFNSNSRCDLGNGCKKNTFVHGMPAIVGVCDASRRQTVRHSRFDVARFCFKRSHKHTDNDGSLNSACGGKTDEGVKPNRFS